MNVQFARQTGFTLLSALFLLVVVSALGGYLVRLATAQQVNSALAVSGLSARYALASGMEWLVYQLNTAGACPALPATVNVDGFQVSVANCSTYVISEGGSSYPLFDVTINAERGVFGTVDFVSVSMRASLNL